MNRTPLGINSVPTNTPSGNRKPKVLELYHKVLI